MDLSVILTFLSLFPTVSYCQDCRPTGLHQNMVFNDIILGHLIKSSGFPYYTYNSYTDECWLFINSNHSNTLRIEFRDFKTEACCDIVQVYDDNFANPSRVIARLSGTELNSTSLKYRSTGRHLFIGFKTDSADERRGWQACICSSDRYCSCRWQTLITYTTRRPSSWSSWTNSWSSWESGSSAGRASVSTGVIVGIVVPVLVAACIVCGICCACVSSRKRSRRRATTTTTAMTVTTTNLPQGTYPVQQGVSYTANQDGTALMSEPVSVRQNVQPQSMADSMQVPAYDSALSYPSPNHAAETSPSAPPSYLAETDRQTVPTTGASTRHTDSSDITHGGSSVPPDTSTQEPASPPPSYDQLYS